ncbi:protein root UVB sensitive 6 isoform X1 [Gossypium hirsutum]|uniref:Protein root UVB sensitive 6 isoform X1 n=1 Tax=Gossypium hirsutum TaxID=3635 RepID=A0ABM3A4G0_GOSHI|nr:protein root UVB sensitive 6 isoform X1 [Gossypium hirsutum]
MKQSTNSTSTSAAQTLTSQESRLLVRETLRISASLASNAGLSSSTGIHEGAAIPLMDENRRMGLVGDEFRDSSLKLICCEEIDGRRWKYVAEKDSFGNFKNNSIRTVSLHTPQAPLDELMSFIRSYVVPEGFPESVTPSYVPYMTWRALKHFFGGAMGVFTTQTLLNSVGISRNSATPGAVAINWILKDGAGRVGKMLFSRQGNKFDYDLKQLRFAGDLLMELGAGVELATASVPHLFLPLACVANVLKNVAAVTSTSTRTPIYKAFAKGENIGDVTAKGECVGNIADLEQNTRRMIGHTKEINGLYYLEEVNVLNSSPLSLISESIKTNKDQIWLYHLRLGHPSFRVLKIMFPSLFKGLTVEQFHCDICELAKHKRTSFPVSNKRTSTPFTLVHSDVLGPSTISNISGARWFVSFIDDCTRVSWIFLLKQKSDVRSVFPIFYNMIKTQFGAKIKRFRSDNAKDYFNQFLSTYFQERGIIHESSCVSTPQRNGVAERKNGHILAITRALLFQKKSLNNTGGGCSNCYSFVK